MIKCRNFIPKPKYCTPTNRYEVEEAIRALENHEAVGPGGLPAELMKVLADEGESDTLAKFQEIVVPVWRRGDVPQQRKHATIKVLHNKKWL